MVGRWECSRMSTKNVFSMRWCRALARFSGIDGKEFNVDGSM